MRGWVALELCLDDDKCEWDIMKDLGEKNFSAEKVKLLMKRLEISKQVEVSKMDGREDRWYTMREDLRGRKL